MLNYLIYGQKPLKMNPGAWSGSQTFPWNGSRTSPWSGTFPDTPLKRFLERFPDIPPEAVPGHSL